MSVNPILLQKLLKDNASDLQDFSKDLKNWGEEMKRKEEFLKKDAGQSTSQKVRKISKKSPKELNVAKKSVKPANRGITNYAAWDKFDADAELQNLEDDINEDTVLTDEYSDDIHDEAILEKEKGNKYVKNQKWEEAIKSYTKAINCYSYDPIFYANRALCYLKLNKFEETEKDCTLSLKLDSTYVKAYQRRAAACSCLNKLEQAEMDLLKVLELEPKNEESRIELEKVRQKLNRHTEKPVDQRPVSKFTASRNKTNLNKLHEKTIYETLGQESRSAPDQKLIDDSEPTSSWPSQEDTIPVKPIQKPPHSRSQKPLKRISITEVDAGVIEKKHEYNSAVKKHVMENHEEPNKPMSAFSEQNTEQLGQSESTALPKPNAPRKACLRTDDFKVIERVSATSGTTKDVKNTVNDNKKLTESGISNAGFVGPKNSVQFYLSWKNLKTAEEKYLYLKSVEPRELPKIFLNSLESDVFSNILEVMVNHYMNNRDPVFDTLRCFAEVKRFSAITMFLTSDDKHNLWKLFDYIKENNEQDNTEVDKLKKKFEL